MSKKIRICLINPRAKYLAPIAIKQEMDEAGQVYFVMIT